MLVSFVLTLNFVEIWLKSSKNNYLHRTTIYFEEINNQFKKISATLLEPDDYKNKRQLLLTDIRV